MFSLYQGLNRRPSDVEADDIPICHLASSKYTPNNRLGKKFKAKIVSEKAQVWNIVLAESSVLTFPFLSILKFCSII